jgi:hypothetical protein
MAGLPEQQRRCLEALGLDRVMHDVTPSLGELLRCDMLQQRQQAAEEVVED